MKMNYNLLQNCNITTDKFTNKQKLNKMKEYLKVISVRYFNTRRGLGYEATTNKTNVIIWNDGNGGGTYIDHYYPYTKDLIGIMSDETYLENLIDEYEGLNELEINKRIINIIN